MSLSNRLKNQHLLWRAAFGPMAENVAELDSMSPKKLWEVLKKTSADQPSVISIASNPFTDKAYQNADGTMTYPAQMTPEQKKALARQGKEDIRDMNIAWLSMMTNSKAQLREKMSLFWHGHFACRSNSGYFAQDLVNMIRTNALENFGDMLRAISKSPAMLQFLNNQQNRKGHPNENFAREVMELFTLGRGNYTEKDIKEAARAFTGWGANVQGDFVFRKGQHDDGNKTVLGHTGRFDGDDILNILLEE